MFLFTSIYAVVDAGPDPIVDKVNLVLVIDYQYSRLPFANPSRRPNDAFSPLSSLTLTVALPM